MKFKISIFEKIILKHAILIIKSKIYGGKRKCIE